jgi:hypothetical protein
MTLRELVDPNTTAKSTIAAHTFSIEATPSTSAEDK